MHIYVVFLKTSFVTYQDFSGNYKGASMSHDTVTLIGYASDVGGAKPGSGEGASILKNSIHFNAIQNKGLTLNWEDILEPELSQSRKLKMVQLLSEKLSFLTARCVLEKKFFTVLGGDHTSAIGTWSGVSHAKHKVGPIGLIWIDAHLDSHTPDTSQTGNLHGMPLACLLGYGDPQLTQILNPSAKLRPENICVIGARSYEQGELELLKKLNVRIYFMEEVKQRGIRTVLEEAIQFVNQHTSGFGLTLDIDSIDPFDAPGTGVAEKDGINGEELCQSLTLLCNDPRLMGAEIVEFDPKRDKDHKTEKLIARLLTAISTGKLS
jgi:arginase